MTGIFAQNSVVKMGGAAPIPAGGGWLDGYFNF